MLIAMLIVLTITVIALVCYAIQLNETIDEMIIETVTIGDTYRPRPLNDNPFSYVSFVEVVDIKDDWVQYRFTSGGIIKMSTSIKRFNRLYMKARNTITEKT